MTGRKSLTKFQFGSLFHKQKGLCGCGCGQPLEEGQVDEEHTIPNFFKPGKPDALWRRDCHKKKTAKDKGDIAKANRLAGKTGQQARRKRNGPQIKGRGFNQSLKKKMDGSVERRS